MLELIKIGLTNSPFLTTSYDVIKYFFGSEKNSKRHKGKLIFWGSGFSVGVLREGFTHSSHYINFQQISSIFVQTFFKPTEWKALNGFFFNIYLSNTIFIINDAYLKFPD